MALKDVWKQGELENRTLAQIVHFVSNNGLRDDEESSREFREYLSYIPLAEIRRRVDECLQQDRFTGSGKALQDIVNEIGRRLDFQVEDGLYQGRSDRIGYDGLWELPDQKAIVVEVKTTDVYATKLGTIAKYRHDLIEERPDLADEFVSILLVVGRQDTGVWEEQIRGSRHAWDMRVISVDALLNIAEAKEKVESLILERIYQILIPHEFIRLDAIAELVLSIADDSSEESDVVPDVVPEKKSESADNFELKNKDMLSLPVSLRDFTVQRVESKLMQDGKISEKFVRRTRSIVSTPDHTCFLVCMVSSRQNNEGYFWFTISRNQIKIIQDKNSSWVACCCGSRDKNVIFLIPWKEFSPWLSLLSKTERDNNEYFHLHIISRDDGWILRTTSSYEHKKISQYLLNENDT